MRNIRNNAMRPAVCLIKVSAFTTSGGVGKGPLEDGR